LVHHAAALDARSESVLAACSNRIAQYPESAAIRHYNTTSNSPQAHRDLQSAHGELGYAPEGNVSAVATQTETTPYIDPRTGVLADAHH
jgi:hypothetical protein